MKIASLYAEIGFKFEGLDQLQAMEKTLQGVAAAARNAALAMKILARTHLPRTPGPAAAPAGAANSEVVGVQACLHAFFCFRTIVLFGVILATLRLITTPQETRPCPICKPRSTPPCSCPPAERQPKN